MQIEYFESEREFNNKFPSKIYICSNCKNITSNPYICDFCFEQSNKLFQLENLYTYKIGNSEPITIFTPIEKGKFNEET